jgi:hypothetical protein
MTKKNFLREEGFILGLLGLYSMFSSEDKKGMSSAIPCPHGAYTVSFCYIEKQ